MTAREFWGSTWRELAARRNHFDRAREFSLSVYAGIQATLHNAHFRSEKSQPVWTADMFMPGYRPADSADPQWKKDLAEGRRAMHLVKREADPAQMEKRQKDSDMYAHRIKRAKEAREQGQPAELVQRIMEGVA